MNNINFRVIRGIFYFATLFSLVSCLDDGEYQALVDAENAKIDRYLKANGYSTDEEKYGGVYMKFIEYGDTSGKHPEPRQPVMVSYTQYDLDGNIIESTNAELAKANKVFFDDIVYGPRRLRTGYSITGFAYALYSMKEGDKVNVVIPSDLAFGNHVPFMFEIEMIKLIENDTLFEQELLDSFLLGKEYLSFNEDESPGLYYKKIISNRESNDSIELGDTVLFDLIGRYAEIKGMFSPSDSGRIFYPLTTSYKKEITYIFGEPSNIVTEAVFTALQNMERGDVWEVATLSKYAYSDLGLVNQVRNIYLVPSYTPVHYWIKLKDFKKADTEE